MHSCLKVGVTGGIGSGKSLICKVFEVLNIPVYYADEKAKFLMQNNDILTDKISKLLGQNAYLNGVLNKSYIADRIFNNAKLLAKLNALVHPAVREDFTKWSDKQNAPYVIEESAIIFEASLNQYFDKTILVVASEETRINRVIKRSKISKEQIQSRIQSQWTDEKKIPLADYVINNSGTNSFILQVLKIHELLLQVSKLN